MITSGSQVVHLLFRLFWQVPTGNVQEGRVLPLHALGEHTIQFLLEGRGLELELRLLDAGGVETGAPIAKGLPRLCDLALGQRASLALPVALLLLTELGTGLSEFLFSSPQEARFLIERVLSQVAHSVVGGLGRLVLVPQVKGVGHLLP